MSASNRRPPSGWPLWFGLAAALVPPTVLFALRPELDRDAATRALGQPAGLAAAALLGLAAGFALGMWLQAGWYRRRFRSAEPALWIDADWEDWSAQNPRVQSRARRGVLDGLAETANRFLGRRWGLPFGALLLAVVAALLGQLREQKLDRDAVAARTAYNWESALTAVTAAAVLLGGGLLLVRWRWSAVIRGWRNNRADPQDRPTPTPKCPEPLNLDDLPEAPEPAAPWEPPAPHSKPAVKPRRAAEPRVVNDMPVEDGFGAETVHGDPVASNRPPRRPRPPAQPAADPAPPHDDGMDYDN